MRFPRSRFISLPWALALVGFLATQQFAAIPRILCMEWDGHVEIEIVVAPSGAVPTAAEHGPVPACASDGCGPCTDVLIEMPFQTAHRSAGELHAVDPPEQPVSDLAYQPSTECKIPGDLLRLPLSVVSAALCADGRVPFLLL